MENLGLSPRQFPGRGRLGPPRSPEPTLRWPLEEGGSLAITQQNTGETSSRDVARGSRHPLPPATLSPSRACWRAAELITEPVRRAPHSAPGPPKAAPSPAREQDVTVVLDDGRGGVCHARRIEPQTKTTSSTRSPWRAAPQAACPSASRWGPLRHGPPQQEEGRSLSGFRAQRSHLPLAGCAGAGRPPPCLRLY